MLTHATTHSLTVGFNAGPSLWLEKTRFESGDFFKNFKLYKTEILRAEFQNIEELPLKI